MFVVLDVEDFSILNYLNFCVSIIVLRNANKNQNKFIETCWAPNWVFKKNYIMSNASHHPSMSQSQHDERIWMTACRCCDSICVMRLNTYVRKNWKMWFQLSESIWNTQLYSKSISLSVVVCTQAHVSIVSFDWCIRYAIHHFIYILKI